MIESTVERDRPSECRALKHTSFRLNGAGMRRVSERKGGGQMLLDPGFVSTGTTGGLDCLVSVRQRADLNIEQSEISGRI